jgi:predicted lipoprotein with Yx(FWY)xxD motif
MRHPRTIIAILGLSIAGAVSGVTVAATAGGSPAKPAASLASAATSPAVHAATVTVAGRTEAILVTANGLPLYFYKADTATESRVTGELAALWPPLTAAGPAVNGPPGNLQVVHTSNGFQVTYNGHFLYTFVQDSPGHASGQGVQDFFVATPGAASTRTAPAPRSATTTTQPNAYGY